MAGLGVLLISVSIGFLIASSTLTINSILVGLVGLVLLVIGLLILVVDIMEVLPSHGQTALMDGLQAG